MTTPTRSHMDPASPYARFAAPPSVTPSITVFADVLGFREMMIDSFKSGQHPALLARLRASLDQAYTPFFNHPTNVGNLWDAKAFTDNIVLGYPVDLGSETESDFGIVIGVLLTFQLSMVSHGFFVRGGAALGDLYMDRDIVFGAGLLEAYELENLRGAPPRIVLGMLPLQPTNNKSWRLCRLLRHVLFHLTYYADPASTPQNTDLLVDADGAVFVDYLSEILDPDGDGYSRNELIGHRDQIEQCLHQFTSAPDIAAKYAWAASYHNFRCREGGLDDSALLVPTTIVPLPLVGFRRLREIFPTSSALRRALGLTA